MIMLKTVTGQSISASLIHYLFGSAHGIALQYEQERILQASCLISLCVRILIFHAFHPLHLVMKHLKQLYWLFGTLSGLVGSFIHPYSPEEASVLMHQDMQLCGLLLHAHSCTKSPKTHAYTHTLSEAAGFAPRVGGDIICFHAILAQECPGTICLSVHPALSLFHMCVCVLVRAHVSARMIERKSERSVRQLYLHLYEQIPVGRATEEHTSCLTYIPYQAVFVCTVPWHTHADRHVDEAFALFVGPGQLQGYLHRPWLTYRPPMCKSMLFVFSNFVFYTSKTNSKSSCSAPSSLDLDFGVFPLSKWGDNVESDVA